MRILSAIFLLLLGAVATAQKGKQLHYRFHHLDQTNGLKGNIVTHLLQDDNGYIWISPDYNCVQRYDGVRFRDFSDRIPVNRKNNFYVKSFSARGGQPYLVIDDSAYQFSHHSHKFFHRPYTKQKKGTSVFYQS